MPIPESLALEIATIIADNIQKVIDALAAQPSTTELDAAIAALEAKKADTLAHPNTDIPDILAQALVGMKEK